MLERNFSVMEKTVLRLNSIVVNSGGVLQQAASKAGDRFKKCNWIYYGATGSQS